MAPSNPLHLSGSSFIGKHGVTADLRGSHVVFDLDKRHYIVEVMRVYRDALRGCTLLDTRHLNGEGGPTVALSFVNVLIRD